jgi:hypothetical protein
VGSDDLYYPLQIAVMLPRPVPAVKHRRGYLDPLHEAQQAEYDDDHEDDEQNVDHRVQRHAYPLWDASSPPTPGPTEGRLSSLDKTQNEYDQQYDHQDGDHQA